MTQITPAIRLMTPEEVRTTQLINAGSVIDYGNTTITLGAGRGDRIHIFEESTVLYVLSINTNLEYLGLEIFDSGSGEEFEQIFLQCEWEITEYLGSKWESMKPETIIKRLMNYLY